MSNIKTSMVTSKNILIGVLFFLLLLVPLLISSTLGIVDPFLHSKITSIILSIDKSHIDISSTYFDYLPGMGFLLIILSKITAISPRTLEYFPITGVISIPIIFVLARKITYNNLEAGIITSILIFRWFSISQYGVWPHSFGYILYLLFISVYFDLSLGKRWELVITLMFIFIGIHIFSYNVELWIIGFLLCANLFSWIIQIIRKKPTVFTSSLLLSFIVIYLTFNKVIFNAYIPKLLGSIGDTSISIEYYISTIFRSTPPEAYTYIPPPSPPLLLFSNLMWFIMAIIPIIIFVTIYFIRLLKIKSLRSLASIDFRDVVFLSLFFVWLVDIASYIPIGAINVALTRYFTLIAPLISIILLERSLNNIKSIKHKIKYITRTYIVLMLILSVFIFSFTLNTGQIITSTTKFSYIEPSAQWFFNHTQNIDYIISDHNTQGQYSIVGAELNLKFKPEALYTVKSYKYLVDSNYTSVKNSFFRGNYVVLNLELADKKTTAGGWRDLEPLNKHIENINSNINLNKIYDDRYINVLYSN